MVIVVAAVVVLVIAAIVMLRVKARNQGQETERLQASSAANTAASWEMPDRRRARPELAKREERVAAFDLRPLGASRRSASPVSDRDTGKVRR